MSDDLWCGNGGLISGTELCLGFNKVGVERINVRLASTPSSNREHFSRFCEAGEGRMVRTTRGG